MAKLELKQTNIISLSHCLFLFTPLHSHFPHSLTNPSRRECPGFTQPSFLFQDLLQNLCSQLSTGPILSQSKTAYSNQTNGLMIYKNYRIIITLFTRSENPIKFLGKKKSIALTEHLRYYDQRQINKYIKEMKTVSSASLRRSRSWSNQTLVK